MRSWSFAFVAVIFELARASCGFARPCLLSDLQSCKDCPSVREVLDLQHPDFGEYYRGAYWNGLYAAFRLDCRDVGRELLQHGANPNLGGKFGSFLVTVVGDWPHHNSEVNRAWVDLILHYKVDPDWGVPWADGSARQIVARDQAAVAYPALWRLLLEARQH
jgi:hypothetical protein